MHYTSYIIAHCIFAPFLIEIRNESNKFAVACTPAPHYFVWVPFFQTKSDTPIYSSTFTLLHFSHHCYFTLSDNRISQIELNAFNFSKVYHWRYTHTHHFAPSGVLSSICEWLCPVPFLAMKSMFYTHVRLVS